MCNINYLEIYTLDEKGYLLLSFCHNLHAKCLHNKYYNNKHTNIPINAPAVNRRLLKLLFFTTAPRNSRRSPRRVKSGSCCSRIRSSQAHLRAFPEQRAGVALRKLRRDRAHSIKKVAPGESTRE